MFSIDPAGNVTSTEGATDDGWTHIVLNRTSNCTIVHTQETIDDVMYFVQYEYQDDDMVNKSMVRADSIRL